MVSSDSKGLEQAGLDDIFAPLVLQLARSRFAANGAGVTTWDTVGDAERAMHTQAARQTLQEILAAGYRIALPKDTVRDDPSASSPSIKLDGLDAEACRQQAERFLRSGEPLLAYNAVQEGLEKVPGDLRLRQLQSLALARSGAVARANQGLQQLRREGHADGETLGMLARTHKDLGTASNDAEVRRAHLKAAFDLYDEVYRRALRQGDAGQAYYTGINAATLALLRGELEAARATAREVRRLCDGELERKGGSDYWIHATLAEAALILGERPEAEKQYTAAARAAGRRHGDLASTRKQARLLLSHTGDDDAWLARVLQIPPVMVFSGHLVRGGGVFPPQLEAAVRDEIHARVERLRPVAAYGSAACGTDILCLEAARDMGAEVHVTLPFAPVEFRKQSVDVAPGWGERFDRLLAAADSVVVTSDHPTSGSLAGYEYANLVLTGAGRLRADVLGTTLVGLAVWDGNPARGRGGTADVVALWRERQITVEHVDVTALRARLAGDAAPAAAVSTAKVTEDGLGAGFSYEIKAMLFADAVGFSKMTEDQIPIFIRNFMGRVGELNDRTAYKPINMQTSGDGLYFVFRDTKDAGHYALELNAIVRGTDWTALGLPPSFDLRIGLHCGPIFCCEDPITHSSLFTGSHTSRTARIEPITPPGQVYTSSAFAAVAAATGVDDLGFSYIGRIPLAKQYGSLALYHVQSPS